MPEAAEAMTMVSAVCRDCGALVDGDSPCGCGSTRVVRHPELGALAIAHVDCDAFYAAVEKRDDPSLAERAVVVGGLGRGVVMSACYLARRFGVRSAMPMFEALRRCPDAAVVSPHMEKYSAAGAELRAAMRKLTPVVEPISIDEAFLDLSGTEAVHVAMPAQSLARLAIDIERSVGITVSIGLSYNKFLAKLLSAACKPRGFAVVGRADALDFLADQPVRALSGVGPVLGARLQRDGLDTIGAIRGVPEAELVARYGSIGARLKRFSLGRDARTVSTSRAAKSISAETTFAEDIADAGALAKRLWPLCERVSSRLKRAELGTGTVTLKLKTDQFQILTRARRLQAPTQLARTLFEVAEPLLRREARGQRFRLIGIGASTLVAADAADPADLFESGNAALERTIDDVRACFGKGAIRSGREAASRGDQE